jgi:hypothetical protein
MIQRFLFYRKFGTWCYSDPKFNVRDEPLVEGAEVIFDRVVEETWPGERIAAFHLQAYAGDRDGSPFVLRRVGRPRNGGQDYRLQGTRLKGWLCKHLFDYFPDGAPPFLVLNPVRRVAAQGEDSFSPCVATPGGNSGGR